jgi:hypothetical protein
MMNVLSLALSIPSTTFLIPPVTTIYYFTVVEKFYTFTSNSPSGKNLFIHSSTLSVSELDITQSKLTTTTMHTPVQFW